MNPKALTERWEARRRMLTAFLDLAKGRGFQAEDQIRPDDEGWIIVSPAIAPQDTPGWRVTYGANLEPHGHLCERTYEAAVEAAVSMGARLETAKFRVCPTMDRLSATLPAATSQAETEGGG